MKEDRIGPRLAQRAWFDKLTTLTHSTVLRVILREIEG
jgi:hypothetical protein